jgi:hypothetical protein
MPTATPARIRVKFMAKSLPGKDYSGWLRRFPSKIPSWGACDYIFDQSCRDYDWLVVYDDLPASSGERFTLWNEPLPATCPRAHTLLITTEPSTIKVYSRAYTRQFGLVLTSQEPWAIRHPGAIFSQPGLVFFYGGSGDRGSYDVMAGHIPADKKSEISTVCSSKQQKHTLHHARYDFTRKLKQAIPGLEVFGHGVKPVHDKADALDDYRYHVAIENHICAHHWTEKLSDAFLGACLPFYHGCPNYADYFPAESVVPIDIKDFPAALETIQRTIRDGEYSKRLPSILESRRLVLEEYGLFPLLTRLITTPRPEPRQNDRDPTIRSRHALRKQSSLATLGEGFDKMLVSLHHRFQNH